MTSTAIDSPTEGVVLSSADRTLGCLKQPAATAYAYAWICSSTKSLSLHNLNLNNLCLLLLPQVEAKVKQLEALQLPVKADMALLTGSKWTTVYTTSTGKEQGANACVAHGVALQGSMKGSCLHS